jgi:hypothetical protein
MPVSENQPVQGQGVIELDWLAKALGVVQSERERLAEVEGQIRQRLTNALGPGGSRSVYDPQHPGKKDWKGWKATATEMSYQACVEDRGAASGWVLAQYPEKAEHRVRISPEVPEREVLNVIRTHAKHMLEEVVEVPDYVLNELVAKSRQAGQPVGFGGEVGQSAPPGIKVTQPDSYLTVKFYDPAGDIIATLRADERFTLETIVAAMAGDE